MRKICITPLDSWVKKKTCGDLAAYQLNMLNETLSTAQRSSYYLERLPRRVESLAELQSLPTTSADDLTLSGTGLVCVPQHEISRIVTLDTSGSTGAPKRVYFTEDDRELTVDYFANGLPTVVSRGETMAIFLPCERPGGVGDLIAQALERMCVKPVRHGPVTDLSSCANVLRDSGADTIVGTSVHVLATARYCEAAGINANIRAVLLSADNVPRVVRRELGRIWGCEVYEHYGMTEMGLGGAIDCDAHDGCHIRENDLLFEIIDERGNPLPDGIEGEIAFTTLTRRGMPLVRYRTGDISRIISGRCACGSELKRVAPIMGRIDSDVRMACGSVIRMRDFDEVLFGVPYVSDFRLIAYPQDNLLCIHIDTQDSFCEFIKPSAVKVKELLHDSRLIRGVEVKVDIVRHPNVLPLYAGKRKIT